MISNPVPNQQRIYQCKPEAPMRRFTRVNMTMSQILPHLLKTMSQIRHSRTGEPPLRINNQGVNAIEDSDGSCDMNEWIFPTIGGGLNNWEAKDFIPITFIQE